jgi:hypothetical protein
MLLEAATLPNVTNHPRNEKCPQRSNANAQNLGRSQGQEWRRRA